jgi:hypothetical protein
MFSVLALHSCEKTVKSRRDKTGFSPYIGPSESAVGGPLRGSLRTVECENIVEKPT